MLAESSVPDSMRLRCFEFTGCARCRMGFDPAGRGLGSRRLRLYGFLSRTNFRDNWCSPRLQPIEHSCGDKPYDLIGCGLLGFQLGGILLFSFLRCLKKSLGGIGIDQFVEGTVADTFPMLKVFIDGGLRFAESFR